MNFFEPIINFVLNPLFILSAIFWILVFLAVYLLRNKRSAYTLFFPLLVMFKTKKLNRIINKIASKKPKFWRIFWNVGIFISFGFTIYSFYFFFTNLLNLIIAPSIEQAIVPIIPGVTIDLPIFFYMLLPLLFVITTHEFAHGISASIDGVEIKSTGVLGAGLFYLVGFGAFVEVDEWELSSSKFHRNTRLRIAAAGTYVNAITAGIALLLLITYPFIISPFYKQVPQIYNVLTPEEGGFNYGVLEYGDAIDAIKKQGQSDNNYIYLDAIQKINLNSILDNETSLKCSVGENLTFKVYNPFSDTLLEKNVTLGPRYNIIDETEKDFFPESSYNLTIRYEKASNTAIRITYNYTSREEEDIIVNKINGTDINYSNGTSLEKFLTIFNLKVLNLTSNLGISYIINLSAIGVFVGIQSSSFWLHKNDFAKFFTANWANFWQIEIIWLFIISFSIIIFNMMPIPGFDGDRIMKEILRWIFGEKYGNIKRKRIQRFIYRGDDTDCHLPDYRVENVESIKIFLKKKRDKERSEILLSKNNYELIDTLGDGNYDTVSIKLPEDTKIEENTTFEVTYEYLYNEKNRKIKPILNFVRLFSLGLIICNFTLSFIQFGFNIFWI
jgi:membrane-associated protease RseP (regulator of RpoE activity)